MRGGVFAFRRFGQVGMHGPAEHIRDETCLRRRPRGERESQMHPVGSAPDAFRTDRPWEDYILWGEGLHTCFGAHINRVLIPAILKPLLARPGLRRAAGPLGRIDTGGTPFPVHFVVEYDADEGR